jgi:hypothetical protein
MTSTLQSRSPRLDCSLAEAVRRAGGGAADDPARGRAAHAFRVIEILARERHAAGHALSRAPLSRRPSS